MGLDCTSRPEQARVGVLLPGGWNSFGSDNLVSVSCLVFLALEVLQIAGSICVNKWADKRLQKGNSSK